MIKVHEMQSIAFTPNNFLVVMLNAWSSASCLKLCWHNLSKPIAKKSPSKVNSHLDDQILLLDSNRYCKTTNNY